MKRHPLAVFFVLTLIFSWSFWLPLTPAVAGRWHLPFSAASGQVLGAFGPGLAALVVTAALSGVSGLRRLFERLLVWRVGWVWYWVALLLPAGLSLFTTALHMMFGGDAPNFSEPPIYQIPLPPLYQHYNGWTILIPMFLQHLVLGTALVEELGWRGFLLPRLQARYTALTSSLITSLVWCVWALPLYWTLHWIQADQRAYSLLGIIPATIISTWIFNNTRGSLLLMVLFNNASKITDLFLAAPPAHPLVTVTCYFMVAGLVVALFGPSQLSRHQLDVNCRSPEAHPEGASPVAPVT